MYSVTDGGRSVSADEHACARLLDASVSCWGRNFYGQLGLNDRTDRSLPTAVIALGTNVAQIALGRALAPPLDTTRAPWASE